MDIKQLERKQYQNYKLHFEYETDSYFDVKKDDMNILFELKYFEKPIQKSFDDVLYSSWLENPVVYGAYENNQLVGIIEGSIESWNNRFRISNLLVFDKYRHLGIGTKLIQTIKEEASKLDCRMMVLETQSCNTKAIHFYQKNGFQLIGCDLFCYSNEDIEKMEVRLEMGMILKKRL